MHLYHVETQFVALADPNWLPIKRCLSSSKHQQGIAILPFAVRNKLVCNWVNSMVCRYIKLPAGPITVRVFL